MYRRFEASWVFPPSRALIARPFFLTSESLERLRKPGSASGGKAHYLRLVLVPFMETTAFVLFSRSLRTSHAPGISLCDGGLSSASAQPPSLVTAGRPSSTAGFTLHALHLRSRSGAVHCDCAMAPPSFVLFSEWHLAMTNVVQLTPCPFCVSHVRRVLPGAPISTIRGTISFDSFNYVGIRDAV